MNRRRVGGVLRVQDVDLDQRARRVWVHGAEVRLTPTEFAVLQALIVRAGALMGRESLMRAAGLTTVAATSKSLNVHLGSLRRKLGDDPRAPRLITNVRGQGWRLEVSATGSPLPPRRSGSAGRRVIEIQEVCVEVRTRRVWVRGREVRFTPNEFAVLRALMSRAGKVVSRETLRREVWGISVPALSKTIDMRLGAVRRKLHEDPAAPRLIICVPGHGWRFADPMAPSHAQSVAQPSWRSPPRPAPKEQR